MSSNAFIEVQFPVSKVSKESYKERKSVQGQTLTGLGKWWGRKPLILIRATILGILMPNSQDSKKDREIFLKILTMDEKGLWLRKDKSIPVATLYKYLTTSEKESYFEEDNKGKVKLKKGLSRDEKRTVQKMVFERLSYDEKLKYCRRPEEVQLTEEDEWKQINEHLDTNAYSLNELLEQLGKKRFNRKPLVGDCFSGGGSIPFEAARIGLNVYSSDLNPVASSLTWAGLNLLNASEDEINQLKIFQENVFRKVNDQVVELGIESNELGWRGNIYLYCVETKCPECDFKVPLLPSFMVGKNSKTVLKLKTLPDKKSYDIKIIQEATNDEVKEAENSSTISDYSLQCPNCHTTTPIPSIRRDMDDGVKRPYRYNTPNKLRKWESEDFQPREDDIYTERLYCIRYEEEISDAEGKIIETKRRYVSPSIDDLKREKKVSELLSQNFERWQKEGILPSSPIENGWNTNQLIYEKGWTHWHHLFTPRQLFLHGLLMETSIKLAQNERELVIATLGINRCCDWNSKLCRWGVGQARESMAQTFYNQAFNTMFDFGCKGLTMLKNNWSINANFDNNKISNYIVEVKNAKDVDVSCDVWITDPPYADAVHYHELSEFFLAWDKEIIKKALPNWYNDSKRILAVQGTGTGFNESMVEVYSNLSNNMTDNGVQVVLFTHSDVKVWAELSLILWSAGLQVTAAWNIATETEAAGLKHGNYVKGTVLLVLTKQNSEETAYLDELYPDIEEEVKYQIDSMKELDDKEEPNFSDADYLLAAYAASLKILTSYKKIEDIDVQYELSKSRDSNDNSPIVEIIQEAVKVAYDYLIPSDFDNFVWKTLTSEERFYIKGIEIEKNNIYQLASYQELARGFGANDYKELLQNTRANQARLKTATEFTMKGMNDSSNFGNSLVRKVLVAIYLSVKEEDTLKGRNWLKTEMEDYWNVRSNIIEILTYISSASHVENMEHWKKDAYTASILKELIANDGI
ncbi:MULTISPECIES: anti-phage-associated DUF1156 domain-containing protein [Bacillus]|uniref:anti-phage-associated DUF1156 domain-containing protein n=1 Tax=Bacillus TaxID=1386 RepID=UPI001C7EF0BB|nr:MULTISPECIES: anti-phage-associated DUF1156 domain-containing protein [Bacillus]BCC61102.1 DNA methylase [Bacillus cereus]